MPKDPARCPKCGKTWDKVSRYIEEKDTNFEFMEKGYECCKDSCPPEEHLHRYSDCGFWDSFPTFDKTVESKSKVIKVAGRR
jgi:hypothetical protein